MQNYLTTLLLANIEEYQQLFQAVSNLNLFRKYYTNEELSIYMRKPEPKVSGPIKASNRKFQNTIIKLTSGKSNILAFTKDNLKRSFDTLDKQYLSVENILQNSSFMVVDDKYLPSILKTSVFSDLIEFKKIQMTVQTIELDEALSISAYRFQNQQQERQIYQKNLISKGQQSNKKMEANDINDGNNKKNDGQQEKKKGLRNIIIKLVNKNFCNEFSDIESGKLTTIVKQIRFYFDKIFIDLLELMKGVPRKDKSFRQQCYDNLKKNYLIFIYKMLQCNKQYTFYQNKIQFQVLASAFIMSYAIRPNQLIQKQ